MENKIEIGEYVRTKKGQIYKVAEITPYGIGMNDSHDIFENGEQFGSTICEEKDIITHSKDIIDLIEVGDIVDGNIVSDVDKIENRIYIEWANGDYINTDRKCKGIIKSILTHEQYERNAYRLEE